MKLSWTGVIHNSDFLRSVQGWAVGKWVLFHPATSWKNFTKIQTFSRKKDKFLQFKANNIYVRIIFFGR